MEDTKYTCCICLELCTIFVDCKCNTNICYTCFKQYLLTFYETPLKTPCCVQCDRQYSMEFIGTILTKKFAKTYYKDLLKKREEIELQRPSAHVQLQVQRFALQPELDKIKREITAARAHYKDLLWKRKQIEERIRSVKTSLITCSRCPNGNIDITNMTCFICQMKHCSKCQQYSEEGHACDQTVLDTKKYIEYYTKKCPGCSTPVQKMDGCNHMYCMVCKCKFDWANMRILNLQSNVLAQIPDYRRDTMQIQRDPLDVQCGGFNEKVVNEALQKLPLDYLNAIKKSYYDVSREYTIIYNTMANKNNQLDDARIKRLTNTITLDSFHRRIFRIENANKKYLKQIQFLAFLKDIFLDMLRCYDVDSVISKLSIAATHNIVSTQYDDVRKYVLENYKDTNYFPSCSDYYLEKVFAHMNM